MDLISRKRKITTKSYIKTNIYLNQNFSQEIIKLDQIKE